MKKLLVFGINEFAEIAHYYFSLESKYKIAAFTVDSQYIEQNTLHELPIEPFENIEKQYPAADYDIFIAIGYANMNRLRESKCHEALAKGYTLASYISNKAIVPCNLNHGYNCFFLEHTIVQPYSYIGNNVIVMNKNLISHHCKIEENCFISANVTICGSSIVKKNCFLGANSCIRDGITVAPYTLVGACSYISRDTKENGVYISESTKRSKQATNMMPI